MNQEKSWVLINLSDFTGLLDQALEGEDLSFDDRLFYLGHLATCARLFRVVVLDEPSEELMQLIHLESKIFTTASRPDERGAIVKEAWLQVQPILQRYASTLACV